MNSKIIEITTGQSDAINNATYDETFTETWNAIRMDDPRWAEVWNVTYSPTLAAIDEFIYEL